MTKTKIKIMDIPELREKLDKEYEKSSQIKLCQYALLLASHILEIAEYKDKDHCILLEGYRVSEQWQKGEARVYDVRQAGFKVHRLAKECEDVIFQNALRCVGQAIAVGHMREHAMVASDYAIKVINLRYPGSKEAVKKERLWQLETLIAIKELV